MTLDIERLDRWVRGFPAGELAERRWFGSKSRVIASLTLDEAAPLQADADAPTDAALLIIRVSFADEGGDERYLLPVVASGDEVREARDGDGVWRRLAEAVSTEVVLPALHGSFVFHSLEPMRPAPTERTLGGEQSNTSIVLGSTLLKLYRHVEEGENPDLEVPRFLSRAGFDRVPAVLGYARHVPAAGEPSAVAMLQAFVADASDGWSWLLAELRHGEPTLDAVRAIGELTARMHATLASRPDDPAFPARPATRSERDEWRAAADGQLAGALVAAPEIAPLADAIREAFAALSRAGAEVPLSRVHGDYHLGQLLHDGAGRFWVIDFEGEPARSPRERRRPGSPLRDVAGMLRSLDYAARTAGAAEGWLPAAREALLAGYRSAAGQLDDLLLRAFELEKACYEVRYEVNNRPDWVRLPLDALRRLAVR